MNAHALAALHTAPPSDDTTETRIEHTAAVTLAWSALDREVRRVAAVEADE